MKVLFCKIFGHKFFFTTSIPSGIWHQGVSGIWWEESYEQRHETSYCTRCGLDKNNINKKKDVK